MAVVLRVAMVITYPMLAEMSSFSYNDNEDIFAFIIHREVIGWLAREKEEERLKALIEENAKIAETAKHMIAQMEQMAAGARFAPTEKKQETVSSSPVRDAAEWHSDGGKTPFDGPEGAEASPEPVPAVPADDSTGSGDDMDAFMAFMANDGQDGEEDQGGEDNSADEYEEDDEDDYSLVMF